MEWTRRVTNTLPSFTNKDKHNKLAKLLQVCRKPHINWASSVQGLQNNISHKYKYMWMIQLLDMEDEQCMGITIRNIDHGVLVYIDCHHCHTHHVFLNLVLKIHNHYTLTHNYHSLLVLVIYDRTRIKTMYSVYNIVLQTPCNNYHCPLVNQIFPFVRT